MKLGLHGGAGCARLGLWEYAHPCEPDQYMICTSILKQTARLFLLLGCTCSLSSCGTIGSILGYLISLPGNLFNAIVP